MWRRNHSFHEVFALARADNLAWYRNAGSLINFGHGNQTWLLGAAQGSTGRRQTPMPRPLAVETRAERPVNRPSTLPDARRTCNMLAVHRSSRPGEGPTDCGAEYCRL